MDYTYMHELLSDVTTGTAAYMVIKALRTFSWTEQDTFCFDRCNVLPQSFKLVPEEEQILKRVRMRWKHGEPFILHKLRLSCHGSLRLWHAMALSTERCMVSAAYNS